jgi:hypothetical protein
MRGGGLRHRIVEPPLIRAAAKRQAQPHPGLGRLGEIGFGGERAQDGALGGEIGEAGRRRTAAHHQVASPARPAASRARGDCSACARMLVTLAMCGA